jgi:pteridine reductase
MSPTRITADLSGRTLLITGAARRLGRAMALRLAELGADIVVHHHTSRHDADTCAKAIRAFGRSAWLIRHDLSKPTRAADLIDKALQKAGRLDGLINSASVFPTDTLADASIRSLRVNQDVNAFSPFLLTRRFFERVRAGAVIHLLDSYIGRGQRRHVSYHLSKRMLHAMTMLAARDFGPGVRVNAVAPGPVLPAEGQSMAALRKLVAATPLQTPGTPADIADAVVYLLAAPYVTGTTLFVDGGAHLDGNLYGG